MVADALGMAIVECLCAYECRKDVPNQNPVFLWIIKTSWHVIGHELLMGSGGCLAKMDGKI